MDHRFGGLVRLYGREGFKRLRSAHILIVGIGGVGSWTVEAFARSGVGKLTLVDLDDICVSNVNRQIHALDGTLGQQKIDVMAQRCQLIQPEIQVEKMNLFFSERSLEDVFSQPYDYVVDAIDSLKEKCLLIVSAKRRKIPVVSVGGAGGKRFPEEVKIIDLSKTYGDSLLGKVRKKLRQEYGYSRNPKRKFGVEAVFSPELPLFPDNEGGVCESISNTESSVKLDCQSGFGAATSVTGTFGFLAASCAIRKIVGGPAKKLSN